MDLSQAVCIVTGSSSGVGAATARLMASRGARVVINYARSADAELTFAAKWRDGFKNAEVVSWGDLSVFAAD